MKRILPILALALALVALGLPAATIPIQLDSVTRLLVTPTNAWTANKTTITAAVLATPTTSASVAGWLTDETGSGSVVFSASPTFVGQVAFGAGSVGAPAVVYSGDTNTGFYFGGADDVYLSTGGARSARFTATALALGSSSDAQILRRAVNHILTGPSTGASFSVANIDDLGINYEWGGAWWNANILNIGTRYGGSGVARDINLVHGGTVKAYIGQYGLGVGTSATAAIPGYFYGSTDGQQMLAMHNPNVGTAAYGALGAYSDAGNVTIRVHSAAHATWPDTGLLVNTSLDAGFAFYSASATGGWRFYCNGNQRIVFDASGKATFAGVPAASTPGLEVTGVVFTGGTATTTVPLASFGSGSAGNYSTSGTMLGINAPAAFAGNLIHASVNGAAPVFTVDSTGITTAASSIIATANGIRARNNAGQLSIGASDDVVLGRDAAYALALRLGTNPQAFRVYNTYTDASNYERGMMMFSANIMYIGTENAGTGTARDLQVRHGGVTKLTIASATTTVANDLSVTGNFASGGFVDVPSTGTFRFLTRTRFTSPSDGVLTFLNNASNDFGRLQFGGTTSSFPALKRNGATVETRLADDSGFAGTQSLYFRYGAGSPEGVVTAPVGALYGRTDGGAGTSIYVKESGAGNTGWVAK